MATANFFDKAALNASQVLQDYDRHLFERTLNKHTIGIAFGKNATSTHEGRVALDLIVRLSARLYPNLKFINLSGNKKFEEQLEKLCKAINPVINIENAKNPTIFIVAGIVNYDFKKKPTYFIGSDGWDAKFSPKNNIHFGQSSNIFGAACAVCFGLANLFRKIFKKNLPFGTLDSEFTFSTFYFAKDLGAKSGPQLDKSIDLRELFIVGIGAIGNSMLWALENTPSIKGKLHLIDKEKLDLSNLQRYSLALQEDVNKLKVDVAKKSLKKSKLKIIKEAYTWQEFLLKRSDWQIGNVVACVDSAEDRMAIQAALPKSIFNGWTQRESVGISRHHDFINSACLMCLYFPEDKKMDRSEEISINLGIPQYEQAVREYLATGKPLELEFLKLVSQAKNIDISTLKEYEGDSMEVFHSKAVCGGTLMTLSDNTNEEQHNIEVPLAFESALAGILLAAEVVIHTNNLRKERLPILSTINLLRPLSKYINEKQAKHRFGRCICCDDDYRSVYKQKWNEKR